ncbi:hypothetical protein [Nocardia grenadensis]
MKIKKKHLKDLLERAFEAGENYQNDLYWYARGDDFTTWYEREFVRGE